MTIIIVTSGGIAVVTPNPTAVAAALLSNMDFVRSVVAG